MKKTLFTLIALSFVLLVKAQSDSSKDVTIDQPDFQKPNDSQIFTSVEHVPEYPGGLNEFGRYLGRSIVYPKSAIDHHIQGRVIISFIVERDGSLSDIKVVHSVSPDIDNESLRVMRNSPKWKPGTQNGRTVRVAYSVPISFSLSGK